MEFPEDANIEPPRGLVCPFGGLSFLKSKKIKKEDELC
jgi:hypothetical protein